MKKWRYVAFAMVFLSTGCSTLKGGHVTPSMSDAAFVKADSEARNSYLKKIQEEDELLTVKKDVEYLAGRPVFYGDKATGFTIQWNKKLSLVSVYPGHITGQMGLETAAVMVFKADGDGNIHYQNQGGVEKPTTLLSSVATQEGLGRLLVKGGFQVLSAGVNGALAAKINSDASCGSDCGNVTMVNTGGNAGARSESQAGSRTDINAILGSCPGGSCVPIPVGP
jgi:hypothetical protein